MSKEPPVTLPCGTYSFRGYLSHMDWHDGPYTQGCRFFLMILDGPYEGRIIPLKDDPLARKDGRWHVCQFTVSCQPYLHQREPANLKACQVLNEPAPRVPFAVFAEFEPEWRSIFAEKGFKDCTREDLERLKRDSLESAKRKRSASVLTSAPPMQIMAGRPPSNWRAVVPPMASSASLHASASQMEKETVARLAAVEDRLARLADQEAQIKDLKNERDFHRALAEKFRAELLTRPTAPSASPSTSAGASKPVDDTRETDTPTDLLDAHDLAALLRTSVYAIGQSRRAGLLPAAVRLPVRGKYRWRRADIDAWINEKSRAETTIDVGAKVVVDDR